MRKSMKKVSRRQKNTKRQFLFLFLGGLFFFNGLALSAGEFREIPLSSERQKVLDSHIEQLASSSTKIREQAKRDILTFGSSAIESLQKAQNHPDLTAAESAVYCLRLLTQGLSRSDDPPEVKKNLNYYSTNEWYLRSLAISRLSYLEPDTSLRPLLRILLHEKNTLAGQSAALAVYWTLPHIQPFRQWPTVFPDEKAFPTPEYRMEQNKQSTEERLKLQNEIREYLLSESARTPGKTLLLQLMEIESTLRKKRGEAAALLSADNSENKSEDEVKKVTAQNAENAPLESGHIEEIEEMLNRFLEEAQKDGKPEKMTFLQEMIYVCADILFQSGHFEEAEAFFRNWQRKNVCALEFNHFQSNEMRLQTLHIRFYLTQKLIVRGNWDWGKSEMKNFLAQMRQTERIRYARYFCTALKATGDFGDAADQMKELRRFQFLAFTQTPETPLGQKTEKQDKGKKDEEEISEYTPLILYFQGLEACSKEDYPKAKKFLTRNMELGENCDIDGLILARKLALFTNDAEWLREVESKINHLLEETQKSIQVLKKNPLIPKEELLMELNLFAWLAVNTERRLEEAQKYAMEAVDLSPDSESIRDTLAMTFAAQGNFEKALEVQLEAVKINPHELELIQNLEKIRFFQTEQK